MGKTSTNALSILVSKSMAREGQHPPSSASDGEVKAPLVHSRYDEDMW